jgi:hypothetical protein
VPHLTSCGAVSSNAKMLKLCVPSKNT